MSTSRIIAHRYEVLGFVLTAGEDETPVSRTVHCGAFASVEEAFEIARELAVAQWRGVASSGRTDGAGGVDCDVECTDFGYDVCNRAGLIARFWIFDPCPGAIGPG